MSMYSILGGKHGVLYKILHKPNCTDSIYVSACTSQDPSHCEGPLYLESRCQPE